LKQPPGTDSHQLEKNQHQKKTLNRTCPVVEALVDFRYLLDPTLALQVLQFEYLRVRPVKVISNVRYLLIEPL
jgi:hypothetical protein